MSALGNVASLLSPAAQGISEGLLGGAQQHVEQQRYAADLDLHKQDLQNKTKAVQTEQQRVQNQNDQFKIGQAAALHERIAAMIRDPEQRSALIRNGEFGPMTQLAGDLASRIAANDPEGAWSVMGHYDNHLNRTGGTSLQGVPPVPTSGTPTMPGATPPTVTPQTLFQPPNLTNLFSGVPGAAAGADLVSALQQGTPGAPAAAPQGAAPTLGPPAPPGSVQTMGGTMVPSLVSPGAPPPAPAPPTAAAGSAPSAPAPPSVAAANEALAKAPQSVLTMPNPFMVPDPGESPTQTRTRLANAMAWEQGTYGIAKTAADTAQAGATTEETKAETALLKPKFNLDMLKAQNDRALKWAEIGVTIRGQNQTARTAFAQQGVEQRGQDLTALTAGDRLNFEMKDAGITNALKARGLDIQQEGTGIKLTQLAQAGERAMTQQDREQVQALRTKLTNDVKLAHDSTLFHLGKTPITPFGTFGGKEWDTVREDMAKLDKLQGKPSGMTITDPEQLKRLKAPYDQREIDNVNDLLNGAIPGKDFGTQMRIAQQTDPVAYQRYLNIYRSQYGANAPIPAPGQIRKPQSSTKGALAPPPPYP